MINQYKTVISSKHKTLSLGLSEVFKKRELIWLFVKRDFLATYKQTILGPLWFIINPLLTTLIFTVVFGGIAKIPTGETPQFLFYMASNIVWAYFSSCTNKISNTFITNSRLFSKVYFPRLISPIATSLSQAINFAVQYAMFLLFALYYAFTGAISPNIYVLLTPILLLMCSMLSIGVGIIISSLTTKYKDLSVLVSFGLSLWMYLSPVVYPAAQIPDKFITLFMLNPISPIIEAFRYAYFGIGMFSWLYLFISLIISAILFLLGTVLFNRAEKTFTDTI